MNFDKAARPLIMGRNGMISSGHCLASLAGVKVLQEGGNAVDAALAAAFVMTVVKPETCGPGGDLFALVYTKKTGKVEAINSSGPAPAKATVDYFREHGLKSDSGFRPLKRRRAGGGGWLARTTPKVGNQGFIRLTADAVRLAREGFPVQQDLVECYRGVSSRVSLGRSCLSPTCWRAERRQARRTKRARRCSRTVAPRAAMASTAARSPRRSAVTLRAEGGLLAEDDLQGTVAQWLEPAELRLSGLSGLEQPPVSQGFMVLEMLNIVEAWPINDGRVPSG